MKVLHIIQTLSLGGAARALITCAVDCTNTIASTHLVVSLVAAAPAALELCQSKGLNVLNAPSFDALFKAMEGCDLVHCHFWNTPEMYALFRKQLPPMRLLIKFNIGGKFPPHVITPELVEFGDFIQTTGPFAHDLPVFKALNPDTKFHKVHMIYGAADFNRVKGINRKAHDRFNVSYIGTVNFVKMHPDYVFLNHSIDIPDVNFFVCGLGNAYPILEAQVKEINANDKFQFLGECEDIRSILDVTDVFGYPLCKDNYSSGELIIQEVSYAGIPIVIFPYGGAKHLVVNDFTGYIVHSAMEYHQAIEHLYHNPEERLRLGNNAHEYAKQIYGNKNVVRKTASLYKKMMKQSKRKRIFDQTLNSSITKCQIGISDLQHDYDQVKGAYYFARSIGDTASQFMISLTSSDKHEQFAAEEQIAESSDVLEVSISYYCKYYPNDSFLSYWSGLIAYRNGEFGQAAVRFSESIKIGADQWRIYWYLAKTLAQFNEIDLAKQYLERILKVVPELKEVQVLASKILGYDHSSEIDDNQESMRFKLEYYLSIGELDKAEETGSKLFRSHSIQHQDVEIYYKIALTMHKMKQYNRAEKIYLELISCPSIENDLLSWVQFKLGELYLDLGNSNWAKECFFKALDLNPGHTKAQIFLIPENEPLNVRIGDSSKETNEYISVPISLFDQELWDYYFSHRAIDNTDLDINSYFTDSDVLALLKRLSNYIKPGGVVRINTSDQFNVLTEPLIEDKFEIIDHNNVSLTLKRTSCIPQCL